MEANPLAGFPSTMEIRVAWGEMDALGHVNNTVYFRYFESARVAFFERLGWMEIAARTGVGPILHSTSIRYRLPVTYPDTLVIGLRVRELAFDRFLTEYLVWSTAQRAVVAEGNGLVVSFDYRTQRKTALPEAVGHSILDQDPEAAGA